MLEDNALDAELTIAQLTLSKLDFSYDRVWTRADFLHAITHGHYDVVLADHVLPGFDGDTALELVRTHAPDLPFLFVSGTLTEELAVQALKRGARDYVVKQRLQRLPDAIVRAIDEAKERQRRGLAEAALQASQAHLHIIANALPALIAHLSPDHRYRFANNAYVEWHGRSPDALVGLHVQELIGEEAFARIQHHLERALSGERVRFEMVTQRQDGTLRYAQVDCVPDFDAHGQVTGYHALARDISDLKQAEQQLREVNEALERQVEQRTQQLQRSERRLQAIFESSFHHQSLLATDGCLIDSNVASLDAILVSKDDVRGLLFWDAPWFSSTPQVQTLMRQAVLAAAGGVESRQEVELDLPSGKRSFDFSLRPLFGDEGKVVAVVSEAVETTERRQAEETLRQSQKIEAVGQLTGGIAHDFNNILTVIGGNIEHAKMMIDRSGDASKGPQRALDNALKGVMRAASLTQRLLAFSRRQPLQSVPVDLNAQVGGMQEMLRRTLGEQVQLEINVAPDVWCVEADPSQLEASVLNLAVNARDAMPEGGHLRIQIANIHLDEDYIRRNAQIPPGDYVMLRVSDSGHGMPEETLARVFEPFFTTKEVGRGTGLGLSMVYGFIKQSGGHVQVRSAVDEGTEVTLFLPRSDRPLPQDTTATAAKGYARYAQNEETILVAEDNDDVRAYTVEALRQLGYRVLEAHDGASALRLLARPDVKVDLLFSDMVMPGMSGRMLADQARRLAPQLRILFTSGYPRDPVGAQPERSYSILAKPFTRSDLAGAIGDALRA
ncbi:PAS domain-containing protein [Xanthomonas maliensis]|nr:PAS domain-containing protein [Xanthomonas maliensis]KAB7766498.1 hybrid sensor histidine kinase/response regulator [Xanthomonas maliensis]